MKCLSAQTIIFLPENCVSWVACGAEWLNSRVLKTEVCGVVIFQQKNSHFSTIAIKFPTFWSNAKELNYKD